MTAPIPPSSGAASPVTAPIPPAGGAVPPVTASMPPADGAVPPVSGPLPVGFAVRLNRHVRVRDGGRTLVGGAPTRVLYLTERARALIVDRTVRVTGRATATLADRLLETGMADPIVAELPAATCPR